jgi:hypothetical protein
MFMKQSHLRRYAVTLAVSYMEIYKDEVYDLLVTRENVSSDICSPLGLCSTTARLPNLFVYCLNLC